jgi:hypothetical protein
VTGFTEDAGFLLSSLTYETTGVVGAVFWMAAGEFSADEAHLGPRVMVVVGKGLSVRSLAGGVAVTLSSPSTVVGTLPEAIRRQALTFAALNREVLLAYWGGELNTRSAIERLEHVRAG